MATEGLTMAKLAADEAKRVDLISKTGQRLRSSSDYYSPKLDTAIRCYKIYKSIKDAVDDEDEPNTGVCYAYGIIEDSVAGLSESILNSRVPTPAKPKLLKDESAAMKFNGMARSYFGSGAYQTDFPNSVRERTITGWSWEVDCWAFQYRQGKAWAKQEVFDENGQPFTDTVEIDQQVPIKVGYYTRFPSVFNVFPQPKKISVEKMKWIVEIEENVALEDLKEAHYIDQAGQRVPFFDLTEVEKDRARGAKITPVDIESWVTSHKQQLSQIMEGQSSNEAAATQDDTDQMTLAWVWEVDRVWCVANNKYVIAYIENLYHKPGLRYRLKLCTPQPSTLLGLGMLEPVEHQLYELDDIHILSMRNWIRIINKMVAYNPQAVTHAEDDFKPRAGGKIRVDPQMGRTVASEMHAFDQQDVSPSMLTQESNDKGIIERALGMPDFAKGYGGTKQSHDTLGGLQEIASQSAKRMASIRRQELAGFQKQMWAMEQLALQFHMEKTAYEVHGPDGSTGMMELDLWDIHTDGRSFNFIIEYDPSFGDDALARNQLMVLLEQSIKYNEAIMAQFPPGTRPLVELSEIKRLELKRFGFADMSSVLRMPDGVLTPENELQLMLQGKQVQVNPLENMVGHYSEHVEQFNAPMIREAIQNQKISPDVLLRLRAHIQATAAAIQGALEDPGAITRQKTFAKSGSMSLIAGNSPTRANSREGVADMTPRTPSA